MSKLRRSVLPLLAATIFVSFPSWGANQSHSKPQRQEVYRLVVPSAEVASLARGLAFADFPKAQDILAIARVESRFMANARNKRSHGIMQVNNGPWEIAENMKAGVSLLREYFELLGTEKAAITAYNCGPSNYLKGRCLNVYFGKVTEHRKNYESWLAEQDREMGLSRSLGDSLVGDHADVLVPDMVRDDGAVQADLLGEGEEACDVAQRCTSRTIQDQLGSVKE